MDEAIADATRARREEHDPAAVHHSRHHHADAAVHRDSRGEKPVRCRFRSAPRRVEGGARRAARRAARGGREDRRVAGLSGVEARDRAAAAAGRARRQTMRGSGGSRAAPTPMRLRSGGTRRRVSRPIRFTRSASSASPSSRSEMDEVFRQIGRTQGSVKERIAQLNKEQAYPPTEDGRTQHHGRRERDHP